MYDDANLQPASAKSINVSPCKCRCVVSRSIGHWPSGSSAAHAADRHLHPYLGMCLMIAVGAFMDRVAHFQAECTNNWMCGSACLNYRPFVQGELRAHDFNQASS